MNVVILAAGMGKRMQSALPKVLHPLAGKPLLQHVIDTARSLNPSKLCVIYGHGGAAVPSAVHAWVFRWRHRNRHRPAAAAAGHGPRRDAGPAPGRRKRADPGAVRRRAADDVSASLQRLVEAAGDDKLAILTVVQDNPFGLGRIIREGGNIVRIVEEKDANEEERAIKEINSGIMVIPTRHLTSWLGALKNNNAQGEYYLTDIVAQAVAAACRSCRRSRRPNGKWPA
jgi:bifunctional UDP-N-acetylglucosamine pyrophosphorylase/glucosamine-1-phosphate N-acetyltransferase